MAAMVPMGMDFWASRRSPERLEPAMMPGRQRDRSVEGQKRGGETGSNRNHSHPSHLMCNGLSYVSHMFFYLFIFTGLARECCLKVIKWRPNNNNKKSEFLINNF